MSREVACPNCGGPIEFKMGSAYVLACPWCKAAVMRTDRDLQTLGILADLVPTAPELNVGDTGSLLGGEIVVGGRLQLDHGRGPWDEWYVENTQTRQWAWLAKAQGRWYYTLPVAISGPLPTWEQMGPGQRGSLPGVEGEWVVGERGESKVLGAEGELPTPIRPGVTGRYVDLSNAAGGFATIDYGAPGDQPQLFVGRSLNEGEFTVGTRAMISPVGGGVEKVEAKRLRCPTCGDAVPVRLPSATERVTCGSCGSLHDYSNGELKMLTQLEGSRQRSPIPLGSEGTLDGEQVMVIGFMERATQVDHVTYRWREFLLHAEGKGFRWLLEDNGHFQYIRPLETGAVQRRSKFAKTVSYQGKTYPMFSRANAWVETVVGEFYWKVSQGDEAELQDFAKPPTVISAELTNNELVYSRGQHIEPADVWSGLGLQGSPPHQVGVGIIQPNPHSMKGCLVSMLAAVMLIAIAVVTSGSGTLVEGPLQLPPVSRASPDETGSYASTTPPFHVDGPTVLSVEVAGTPSNQYIGANCALINEATREVREFYIDFGRYNGVEGGYGWSEGSSRSDVHLDRVSTGDYRLRIDPFWTAFPQPGGPAGLAPPTGSIRVSYGDRSPTCFMFAFVLLLLPGFFTFLAKSSFETRRNENKNA